MISGGAHKAVLTLALLIWLGPRLAYASPDTTSSLLFDLRVPGGVSGLLTAAGLHASPEPSLALLPLIRALHAYPSITPEETTRRDAVAAYLNAPAGPGEADSIVALPLSPDIWTSVVFAGKVARDDLLKAILADRRAALFYYGLMSLDEPTLAFLAEHKPLLSAILEQAVPVFAVYGRSIHIRDGALTVPGGPSAQPLWEEIVGEPAHDVPRFILTLLTRDAGRCAYLYDTVAHLDKPRQIFALGLARPADAAGRFRRLYSSFVTFEINQWRLPDFPFVRRPNDPASVLMRVAATRQGELAPPAPPALWKAVFDGRPSGCRSVGSGRAAEPAADAAWLLERLYDARSARPAQLLETVDFGQRAFAQATRADGPDVCETLVGFPVYEGLLLTLEAIGGFSARDYVGVVRAASSVTPNRYGVSIAQIQGALAIIERGVSTGSVSVPTARQLVRDLFGLDVQPPGGPGTAAHGAPMSSTGHVAGWMITALLPALHCAVESVDECLAGVVSGPPSADQPIIAWEGDQYRLDYRASGRERIRRAHERQHANRLSDVLAIFEAGRALARPSIARAEAGLQAAILKDVSNRVTLGAAERFGVHASSPGEVVGRAAQAASRLPARDGSALVDLLDLADVLLADTLTSFVYAMAISDAESSLLLAGDPARRHDFGTGAALLRIPNGPWRVAQERRGAGGQWIVQGSLLGLNRVLAPFSVRRLSLDTGDVAPTLDAREASAFVESALALNPSKLTDADRDRFVEAIQRGRSRLPDLVADSDAFATAASGIGISEWRWSAARWTAQQPHGRVADLFSLTELFWLGQESGSHDTLEAPAAADAPAVGGLDAWGVGTRPFDGAWRLRLPRGHAWEDLADRSIPGLLAAQVADLHLRIGECLAELHLPSALAAGVASYAVWDFTMEAQMADADDWLGLVRAAQSLSSERVVEYVAALTAPDGPLVPVRAGDAAARGARLRLAQRRW